MIPKRLTAPLYLGCLAAAFVLVTANAGSAFQQTDRPAENERERTPANQETAHTGEFDAFGRGYIRMSIAGENSHIHNVNEQTRVTIDGEPARLNDLRTGDRIRVTTGPKDIAVMIEAIRRGPRNQAFPEERQETRRRPDFQEDASDETETNLNDQPAAWLGVVLNEAEQGQKGVQVTRIYPSGPAARAGLYSGDRLVQIAGKEVSSPEEAAKIIEESKPNESLEMVVLRGEQRQTIQATLADRREFLFEERFREEQRGEQQGGDQGRGEDEFSRFEGAGVPDHAMMLEQHRRFAEQHQRIEEKLDQVLTELEDLRKQLGQAPRGERRGARRPDLETPVGESPEIEEGKKAPNVEGAIEEVPDLETPDVETPDVETPDVETPDVETPDVDR